LVLQLGTAGAVTGQEPDSAVFRIGEIVVQATRPVTTTGGASAIEVNVESVRLVAPSLEQLMRTLPLVQVRTNSRGEAQFSLRGSGSDARQVAVLVDGVPLSLGWDDRADLSVIPATAAQTITLSRGLPSLLYGPNVLGGVVEIGCSTRHIRGVESARCAHGSGH
jgi:iron complex outermembrane receptor protein